MDSKLVPVDPFDLVIFGGGGDLALRKLLPALFYRDIDAQLPLDSRILAVGRSPMSRDDFLASVLASIIAQQDSGLDPENREVESPTALPASLEQAWRQFSTRLSYVALDALDPSTWTALIEQLAGHEEKIRAVYLATPPDLFGPIAKGMHTNGLIVEKMRIVLEKPVGEDYESACAINSEVGSYFSEQQIFRIDHYLGKETVQNLLALRFGNSMFEPLWRREVIDHVQITVAEELGVGNRIDFYDDIGALRDMVQNHLMQLVCLVAMEPPSSLADDAVRDEKLKVLRALKKITADEVRSRTVRGQYRAGAIAGTAVPGYTEELDGESETETFVALKIEIDNWRWSGVPFYIRTGKRLPTKHSEIAIQFKEVPHAIFDDTNSEALPNRLSILLQPDEGVKLRIMAKEPGPGGFNLKPVSLDLSFEETFGQRYRDAYERLLIEVLRGNPALFMRRDEIETAWQWVDGVVAGWQESRQKLDTYVAGSWGPPTASLLLDRDGHHWEVDT